MLFVAFLDFRFLLLFTSLSFLLVRSVLLSVLLFVFVFRSVLLDVLVSFVFRSVLLNVLASFVFFDVGGGGRGGRQKPPKKQRKSNAIPSHTQENKQCGSPKEQTTNNKNYFARGWRGSGKIAGDVFLVLFFVFWWTHILLSYVWLGAAFGVLFGGSVLCVFVFVPNF